MNKLTKAGIATAAGIALLMGGAGTLAYWNDSANLTGGAITAGTLSINTPVPAGTWSSDKTGAIANIANYKVVPGEKLTYTTTVGVTVVGDALKAELQLGTAAITAANAAGNTTQQNANDALATALGSSAALTATGTGVTNVAGVYKIDTTATSVTVSASITFPYGTAGSNNAAKNGKVDLSNFSLTLTQVAS